MADFAQYYGLIPTAEKIEGDLETMAVLWSQLPRESRCVIKYAPEALWGEAENLLWSIEHSLRVLVWRQVTKDGKKGRRAPKPLLTPAQRAHNEQAKNNALAAKDEIDMILGIGGK